MLLAAGATPLAAQPKSDWETAREERDWKENAFTLPAYPKAADLVEIYVGEATSFKFFVDPASVSVGDDGVVRYTLVARSASGAENISFEGIRCRSGMVRAYAFGSRDGRWVPGRTEWRPIHSRGAQGSQFILRRNYFCPHSVPIRDSADGISALRNGGHRDAPRAEAFGR